MPESHSPQMGVPESDRLIFAGLLGVSTVCLVQFASLERLSACLEVAVYAFAIAIPMLSRSVLATWLRRDTSPRRENARRLADLIGVLGAVTGMAFLLLHLSLGGGVTFVVSCFLCILFARRL